MNGLKFLALLTAFIAETSYADNAPEVISFKLDVSWNSTSLNASIQTLTPEPHLETISFNSSIHHIIVGAGERAGFSPNQLNASIGDTILFTPVKLGDSIAQVSLDQNCQVDGSLSPLNFSRLIFPYLVTTEDLVWFYRAVPQRDYAPRGKDLGIFTVNPSNRHTVNTSTRTSVAPTNFTSVPQASSLLRTGNGPVASYIRYKQQYLGNQCPTSWGATVRNFVFRAGCDEGSI
ncbi:hypothetical protein MMC28_005761 [Mycoblastus sanguinarius]|nr:hypothetical protein [Mycoblastus sanguinarius]